MTMPDQRDPTTPTTTFPETSVLVCLTAMPVIWTALIVPMLGFPLAQVAVAAALAGGAGLAVAILREFRLAHDRRPVPARLVVRQVAAASRPIWYHD